MEEDLKQAIIDRLEGWELVEFLDIPIQDVLAFVIDRELTDDEYDDLTDFVGLRIFNDNDNDE